MCRAVGADKTGAVVDSVVPATGYHLRIYYRVVHPISGNWKSLIRLHTGSSIVAVPLYLPEDPAIPILEVAATSVSTQAPEASRFEIMDHRRP